VSSAFQFGAIEVVASGTSLVSLFVTLVGVVLLGILFYWRMFGKLGSANPADIALLAVLISLVTSRVLSPQYMVWIFGLLAMSAFSPQQNFKRISVLIFVSGGIGQIIYPWWYLSFQQGGVLAVTAQAIRILTLLWATGIAWKNMKELSQKKLDPIAGHRAS
jgi:hypothetical protein